MVGQWNRLCREVVRAPNMTDFKRHLDNTLRYFVMSYSGTGARLIGPFQHNIFTHSPLLSPGETPASMLGPDLDFSV